MAREKGGVSAQRIQSDPNFQRTRENGQEFGRAGKSGKLLRNSIQVLLRSSSDSKMVSRLTKVMMQALQQDQTNARGERNVVDGDLTLLTGFEFNIQGKLSTTFFAPYISAIDRATGEISIDIDDFTPQDVLRTSTGCTHFRIVMGAMELDFMNSSFESKTAESAIIANDGTQSGAVQLQASLSAGSTLPLVLVMGMVLYQEVNGVQYLLNNGAYNALQVVSVNVL